MIHTTKATSANEHDVTVTLELLHSEENEIYGDSGYIGADKQHEASLKNEKGKKSSTKPIESPRKLRNYHHADSIMQKRQNIKIIS